MPRGNYSYSGYREDQSWRNAPSPVAAGGEDSRPHGLAITEPGQTQAIYAKEPERQSTARRSSSSRGRMDEAYEGSSSRGGSSRTTQARRATERTQTRRASPSDMRSRQKKSRRGFAAMSADQQREIARKGGLTVSRNRRHMAEIGRVGGEHSHGGRRARARR